MRFLSLWMNLVITLTVPCNVVAWFITWPFQSGDRNNAEESLIRPQSLEDKQAKENAYYVKNTRPRKFEAPIRMHGKFQQVLSTIHGTESACRKELAQNVVKSMNSCADSNVLSDFARIATICHYLSNNRMDQLPSDCSTPHCMKAMNAEAFQVYSSFRLHVAELCSCLVECHFIGSDSVTNNLCAGREINAQLWMDAMELLITELGDMGESALAHLEKIRQESQEFRQHHDEELNEIMDNLGSLALKQKFHIDMSEQQFNLAKQEFNYQHEQFAKLREKLAQMEAAFAGFDHIVMLLLEIRENQQSYEVFEYIRIIAFYLASLLSARFVMYFTDSSFQANSPRAVYATSLSLSLALELLLPRMLPEYDKCIHWKHRMIGLGATHLLAGLSPHFTLVWDWIRSSCRKESRRLEDTPDEIMDMLRDIIALKTLVPTALLNAKWNPSPTLGNMLNKPPPNYQTSPPALREMALPVAWYKIHPMDSNIDETNTLSDDNLACDYAHSIVAIN